MILIVRDVLRVKRRLEMMKRDLEVMRSRVEMTRADQERLMKQELGKNESWRVGSMIAAESTGESIADYALGKKRPADYGVLLPVRTALPAPTPIAAPTTIDCSPPEFATGDIKPSVDVEFRDFADDDD